MDIPRNAFKRALLQGDRLVGLWHAIGHPAVTEILADSALDWVLIDTEHAPNEVTHVADTLRALAGSRVAPVVRPAWNDPVLFKRLLDVGAQTLLVPYVQSPAEAAQAVAAVRYPPRGIRGVASTHRSNRYGRVQDYFRRADDEMCVLVQLETGPAVDALEAIAAVDGVDGVFIGPSDLSASLGFLGEPRHPEVRRVIGDACRRTQAAGTPIGILAPVVEDAAAWFDLGFSFVAVGSDILSLRTAVDALAERFRPVAGRRSP
jgi:4-hydroxy-2-oxoheptanedioate aldolase